MSTLQPGKTRDEGQWAPGNQLPLNDTEQMKQDDAPLNVRARIENIYAKQAFDSIDKSDLRQGYDGSWAGEEHAETIEGKHFIVRVRSDGKAMSAAAMRTRQTADIGDRGNLQFHWIAIEHVPEIWRRLAGVGPQTTEACGDCPRGIHGSPLAGESLDEILDASPAIEEILRRFMNSPEYADLPGKYKTAISVRQDIGFKGFGRKLLQHRVTSDELADYVDRVVRNCLRQRRHQERISTWALRASEADLR